MPSRRAAAARSVNRLRVIEEDSSRKAYTGDNPITGAEWKQARQSFGHSQAVFGHYLSVHANTVAKRERDEQSFAHPRMARLALEQFKIDIRNQQMNYRFTPITGKEWQAYIDALEMTVEQFASEIDAHPITVSKWLKDEVVFPHANLARLGIRRLFSLHHKTIPSTHPPLKRG
jgi:DNA-binding transcriptional regulator YiaG